MKRTLAVLIGATLLAFSALSANAQTATGVPPFSSTTGGPDILNLGNLNVHLDIPVFSKPGRGLPFYYMLGYDSSLWYPVGISGYQNWQPVGNWGWRGETEVETGYLSFSNTIIGPACNGNGTEYSGSNYVYHDSFGDAHAFSGTTYSVRGGLQCNDSDTTLSATAQDGSGYTINVTGAFGMNVVISSASGRIIHPPVNSSTGAGLMTDSNGNQVSVNTNGQFFDTLSSTTPVLSIAGAAPNPLALGYTDSNNNPQSVTVYYAQKTVQTWFRCGGISEYGPTSVSLIDHIQYPDGSQYVFTYESTPNGSGNVTGRVASIKLPTGGTIAYTYPADSHNGVECVDGSASGLSRQTPDGTTTYARTNVNGSDWYTLVTDATSAQNQTLIWFQQSGNNFYETLRRIYSGTAPTPPTVGNSLRTVNTCYNGSTPDCTATTVNLPITEQDVYTTLDNGVQSRVRSTFDSTYGLPLETDEYDYTATSPLRKTVVTYAANEPPDRVGSVIVEDGNSNPVAITNYYYDQAGMITATSGVPQHSGGGLGNLTEISQWVNTTNTYLNTFLTYEDTGNVLSVKDPGTHTTSFSYTDNYSNPNNNGNTHGFVTTVTLPTTHSPNTQAHSSTAKYDINTGLITDSYGQNNEHTSYSYDLMLRPLTVNYPDGGKTQWTYGIPAPGTSVSQVWQWNYKDSSNYSDFRREIDGLGRVDRTAFANYEGNGNPWDERDFCFDANGRQAFASYAYQGQGWGTAKNCSGAGDSYSYDALNRLTGVKHSDDGSSIAYAYAGRATQVTDEGNGSFQPQRVYSSDALGRLLYVCEVSSATLPGTGGTPAACQLDIGPTGFMTSYQYDLLNNLTAVTQGSQTRSYQYDSLSRRTQEQTPEAWNSITTYSYNADSLLYQRTRPAPNQGNATPTVTTTYSYDEMHRPTGQSYNDNVTPTVQWNYDEAQPFGWTANNQIGRLTSTEVFSNPGGTLLAADIFSHVDSLGRVTENDKCTPRTCGIGAYAQYYAYDEAGNETGFNNGANVSFAYTYNGAGRLTSFGDSLVPGTLLSNVHYGAFGVASTTLGNNVNESYGYNARGALNAYTAGSVYNYSLSFAHDGNLSAVNDTVTGGWNFQYDQFSRLTGVNAPSITWVYDRFGNRWQQNSTVGGPAPSYTFDANNHVSNAGIVYDVLGNTINDGIGHAYSWDAENRLESETDGTNAWSYVYDGFGRRVAKEQNGAIQSEFLYDLAGNKTVSVDGSGNLVAQEFYAGARHLATYLSSTSKMYFHHTDWLGTLRVDSDPTGAAVQSCYNWPYGDNQSCSGVFTSANLFSDDFHDSEDNTEHTLFRQLSSVQGRWLSPDPAGIAAADLTNPRSLNLYAYVNNNPLNAIDPLGLDPNDQDDGNPLPSDCYFNPTVCAISGGLGYSYCVFVGLCSPDGTSTNNGGGGSPTTPPPTEPNVNPSGKPVLSGETLGLPGGVLPSHNPLDLLFPDDSQCEFGECNLIAESLGLPSTSVLDTTPTWRRYLNFYGCEASLFLNDTFKDNSWILYFLAGAVGANNVQQLGRPTGTRPINGGRYNLGRTKGLAITAIVIGGSIAIAEVSYDNMRCTAEAGR